VSVLDEAPSRNKTGALIHTDRASIKGRYRQPKDLRRVVIAAKPEPGAHELEPATTPGQVWPHTKANRDRRALLVEREDTNQLAWRLFDDIVASTNKSEDWMKQRYHTWAKLPNVVKRICAIVLPLSYRLRVTQPEWPEV
jgi:hypothetical protein